MSPLLDLQICYGQATSSSAHVYAQVPRRPEWTSRSLQGTVRGPRAEGIRTLPTTTNLVDLGPGDSILARAIVPDPVFWDPDVPAVYEVDVDLYDQSGVVATAHREIGVRQFGARGTSWYFSGRRWVLRGLIAAELPSDEVDLFRSTNACLVATDLRKEACETASDSGVVLVPILRGEAARIARELRILSRWPAIALAIIDSDQSLDTGLKAVAPNVELVHFCRNGFSEETIPSWASAVAGSVDDPVQFGARFSRSTVPVLAVRELDSKMNVSQRRADCDRLQRDLAPYGDFAGYIV